MAGAIYLGPTVAVGKGITGAIIGGGANSAFQYISMSPDSEFSYYSVAVAAGAGYLAPGYKIGGNTLINMGGAFMTDGPSLTGQGGAIAGSLAGGYFGKYAPDLLAPYVGSFSGVIGDIGAASVFEISNDTVKELIKIRMNTNEEENDTLYIHSYFYVYDHGFFCAGCGYQDRNGAYSYRGNLFIYIWCY